MMLDRVLDVGSMGFRRRLQELLQLGAQDSHALWLLPTRFSIPPILIPHP